MSYADAVRRSRCNGACLEWTNTAYQTETNLGKEDRQYKRCNGACLEWTNKKYRNEHIHDGIQWKRQRWTESNYPRQPVTSLMDIKIPDHIIARFEEREKPRHHNEQHYYETPTENPPPQQTNHLPRSHRAEIQPNLHFTEETTARLRQVLQQQANNVREALQQQEKRPHQETTQRQTHNGQITDQLSNNPDFKPLVKLLNCLTRLRSSRTHWQTTPPKTIGKSLKLFSERIRPPVDDELFRGKISQLTEQYADSITEIVKIHLDHHIKETVKQAHSLRQTDIDLAWSTVRRQLSRSNKRITSAIIVDSKTHYDSYQNQDTSTEPNHYSPQAIHTEENAAIDIANQIFPPTTITCSQPRPQRIKRKDMETTPDSTHCAVKIQRITNPNLIDLDDYEETSSASQSTVSYMGIDHVLDDLPGPYGLLLPAATSTSTPRPIPTSTPTMTPLPTPLAPTVQNVYGPMTSSASPTTTSARSTTSPTPTSSKSTTASTMSPNHINNESTSLMWSIPTSSTTRYVSAGRPTTTVSTTTSSTSTTVDTANTTQPVSLQTNHTVSATTPTTDINIVTYETKRETQATNTRPTSKFYVDLPDDTESTSPPHRQTFERLSQSTNDTSRNDDNLYDVHVSTEPTPQETIVHVPPIYSSYSHVQHWKIDKPLNGQDVLVITDSNGTNWKDKPSNWTVYAFSGATINNVVDLIDHMDHIEDWKLIIISVGVNDIIAHNTPTVAEIKLRVRQLFNVCDTISIPVIFVTPPRSKTFHSQEVIDLFDALQKIAITYFSSEYVVCTDKIAFAPSKPDDCKHYTRSVARNLIKLVENHCLHLNGSLHMPTGLPTI